MSTASRLGTGGLVIGACLVSGTAGAADFEVTGDIAGQGYEVASPFGDTVLGRRRLMTTLGLAAYNLQGEYKPFAPDYSVQVRMRLDADFGVDGEEEDFDPANPSRYVPGYDHTPVDLMYGYVEGRNLADGWMMFRVGRQYTTDVLGWWNFDGGLVRITTPFYFGGEIFGGLEQRGGLPLSTSRWESQGVWRGYGGDIEGNEKDYPSFQTASQAPAFGGALESFGPNWIKGRFVYRRVYNLGDAFTSQFPSPGGQGFNQVSGLRLSSERLGFAGSVFLSDIGGVKGGFAYDLYNQLVSKAYGSVEFYPHEKVVVGADVDFYHPTFDADSIWNWFTHSPITTALGRVAVGSIGGFDATLTGGARLWSADGDPETYATAQCNANFPNDPVAIANCLKFGIDASTGDDEVFSRTEENRETTISPDLMGNVGARYRWSNGYVAADAMLQTGFGDVATNRGNRYGGSVYGKQDVVGGLFWIGARASLHRWFDPLREGRDATSFGYVVAPELFPWEYTKFRVEWEHDMNPLVGQRFRLLGYITLRVDSNLRGGFGSSYGYLGNAI
jgi:hypothetical protein